MAEVITSGKVIQKPEIVLDASDFLPPGVLGVRPQTRDEAGHHGDFDSRDDSDQDIMDMDAGGYSGPNITLPIPTFMKIISQTARVGADKKVLVDVVIETDDFPGITEFDARVTKSTVQ